MGFNNRTDAEAKLAEYQDRDEMDRIGARSFVPKVEVRRYAAGDFLCYDGLELPRRYIVNMEPQEVVFSLYGGVATSREPGIDTHTRYSEEGLTYYVYKAFHGGIRITMTAGQTHTINCNRWQADILLDALQQAWKHSETI